MRIGELAKKANVATSTVRFYERAGLLPRADRSSGRRVYDGTELDRLALITFAQACGFTLAEVRTLLSGEKPGRARDRWTPLAKAKLLELQQTEARLRGMRELLTRVLDCKCVDVGECGRRIRSAASARPRR